MRPHTHKHKRKIAMCVTGKQDISRFVMRNKFVLLCSYLRTELKQFLWSRLMKICRQVITFHSSIYTNIHFMSITKKKKWRPENYSKQDVKQQSPSLRRLIPERVAPPPRTKSMFSLCAILSVTKHLMPVMQRNRNKHWSKALNYFLIIHWRKPKTELLWVISPCGIGSCQNKLQESTQFYLHFNTRLIV